MNKNSNAAPEQVQSLIRPIVDAEGLYLESAVLKRAGKYSTLIVTVDLERGEGAVGSEQLETLSHSISQALDAADPISGAYTLEVSTPGAERALTQWRHWSRAQGHRAHIVLFDGTALDGRIVSVTSDEEKFGAQLSGDGAAPEGVQPDAPLPPASDAAEQGVSDVTIMLYGEKNKQRVELGERAVNFSEIRSARIVVDL